MDCGITDGGLTDIDSSWAVVVGQPRGSIGDAAIVSQVRIAASGRLGCGCGLRRHVETS